MKKPLTPLAARFAHSHPDYVTCSLILSRLCSSSVLRSCRSASAGTFIRRRTTFVFGLSRCEPGRLVPLLGNMKQDADVLFFLIIYIIFFRMQLKPNDVFSPNALQVVFTRSLGRVCNCAPCDLNTYLSIPWRHPCGSKASQMEFCTMGMYLIKGTVCSFREEALNQKSKTSNLYIIA